MSAFGVVPREVPVIASLDDLAPRFRAQIERVLDQVRTRGYDPIVWESLRGDERQRFLYGFGRLYDDGRGIVTNCATGDASWHFYGLAVDVIARAERWHAPRTFWSALGEAAQEHGLEWGGTWTTFQDLPHLQYKGASASPSDRIRAIYQDGGREAVWRDLGAS